MFISCSTVRKRCAWRFFFENLTWCFFPSFSFFLLRRWLLWIVFYSSSPLGCFYGLRLQIRFMHLVPTRRGVDVGLWKGTLGGLNGFLVCFLTNPYFFAIRHGAKPWPRVISAATFFEFVLFAMAVYKTIVSYAAKVRLNGRRSLSAILLHENIVYFFVWVFLLRSMTRAWDVESFFS